MSGVKKRVLVSLMLVAMIFCITGCGNKTPDIEQMKNDFLLEEHDNEEYTLTNLEIENASDGEDDYSYAGNDWVSQEAYTEKIGESFVSGTGIEYKVVGIESNFAVGGGRTRTVLETQDGKRWMIPNLPAFYIDSRTEIIYFNIYEYQSN